MSRRPEPPHDAALARALLARGIEDRAVLRAIAHLHRERFVPPELRDQARDDRALAIGLGQSISQPYIVALMTAELALSGAERVLEIGTGSGYQTAILARLAREVWTIERQPTLGLRARGVLDGQGVVNVHYRIGDGTLGWPEAAPFDRIIVTAAGPAIPPALLDQVVKGGRIVAPIGGDATQELVVDRNGPGGWERRTLLDCRFVRLIGAGGWPEPINP